MQTRKFYVKLLQLTAELIATLFLLITCIGYKSNKAFG